MAVGVVTANQLISILCTITSSVVQEGTMQVGKGKGYNTTCTANTMPSQYRMHCDFGSLVLLVLVFLACDAFIEQLVTLLPWCFSVCLSVTGVKACTPLWLYGALRTDLSLRLDSPMFWAPWHQSMSTNSHPSFSSSTWKRCGVWMCKLGEALNANNDK